MIRINLTSVCARWLRVNGATFLLGPFLMVLLAASAYSQQMATVTRPNATLHGTPVSTGKVMASLEKGTRIEILIAQGTWHLVQSEDYVGWISNGAIKADENPPPATLPDITRFH